MEKNEVKRNDDSSLGKDFELLNDKVNDIVDTAGLEEDQREGLLKQFKEMIEKIATNNSKDIDILRGSSGETILQKLCDEELVDFVSAILNYDVNPDQITAQSTSPPIMISAIRSNDKIMKLLIDKRANISDARKTNTNETVLHLLLKKNTDDVTKIQKIERCLGLLLGNDQNLDDKTNEWLRTEIGKIINTRNKFGDTPMYYATQKWNGSIVLSVLKHGAKIGMKRREESVVNWIPVSTLEEFLDEHCLITNYNTGQDNKDIDLGHPDLDITFDYTFLVLSNQDYEDGYLKKSTSDNSSNAYACCLSCGDDENGPEKLSLRALAESNQSKAYPLPETEPLWHLSQSKDHSKLLKHPVISSFLWLKWIRIRRYYNRNLRFSALFTFVLTWYILYGLGMESNHSYTVLFKISYGTFLFVMCTWIMNDTIDIFRSRRLEQKDGISRQTSNLESNNVFKRNFAEICLNVIESLVLILFMVLLLMIGEKSLFYGLVALLALMISREVLQAMVSIARYACSVVTFGENLVEVSLIVLVTILHSPVDFDLKRHIAAFTIVLSWGELITLIGKHPRNNRINVYVTMLYKVTKSFFYLLLVYVFFILSFALGFYVLFNKEYNVNNENQETESKKNDYQYFNTTWQTFVKTSTMFTGEQEFGNLPFDNENSYTLLAYLFFLSFLFFIVVVLMNLLTGLAVTDISLIQERAEIMGYKAKVDLICKAEAIILNDPYNFLSQEINHQWLKMLPKWTICVKLRSCFYKITEATQILLFYNNGLPKNQFSIKPNKVGCLKNFKGSEFMEQVIKPSKNIILHSTNKKLTANLDSMWNKMKDMDMKIDHIIKKLP